MNQNGLTANTTTLNETTGNSTGSDDPEDSCLLNDTNTGGTNVLLYSRKVHSIVKLNNCRFFSKKSNFIKLKAYRISKTPLLPRQKSS